MRSIKSCPDICRLACLTLQYANRNLSMLDCYVMKPTMIYIHLLPLTGNQTLAN